VAAVKERLSAGIRPGVDEPWKDFGPAVRASIGAKETDRSYGDKSIQRVIRLIDQQDKSDK
jgi:hypothetical protein